MLRRTLLGSTGAAALAPLVGCGSAPRDPILHTGSGVPSWSQTGARFEAFRAEHRVAGPAFSLGGEAVDTIGTYGGEPAQFRAPADMSKGPGGHMYIADTLNHRVQVFDAHGTLVQILGDAGELNGARSVAVLPNGEVHVGTHEGVVVFEGGRVRGVYGEGSVRALRADASERVLVLQRARGELSAYVAGTLDQTWRAEKADALAQTVHGDVVVIERV